MAQQTGKPARRRIDASSAAFRAAVGLFTALCFAILVLSLWPDTAGFRVDGYVLILLFATIGVALLPWLSRLRIGAFEVERLGREVSEVRSVLLRDGVVREEHEIRFYVDHAGMRYLVPDDETARFLRGAKGEVAMRAEDLEPYPLRGEVESVLGCKLLKSGPHIFAILGGKRYHVGMDDLFEWRRHHTRDWELVGEKELRNYPRGR
jgi:hypothetical protein